MPSILCALFLTAGPRRRSPARQRQRPRPASLCAAVAAACWCASAAAAPVTASASWKHLRFEVTDLDPNDGIEAGYRFGIPGSPSQHVQSEAIVTLGPDWVHAGHEASETDQVLDFLQPVAIQVSRPTRGASAWLDPATGAEASSYVGGQGVATAAVDSFRQLFPSWPPGTLGIVLTPHTQLTVSFDLTLRATDAGLLDGLQTRAGASAYIQTYIPGNPEDPISAEGISTVPDSFADTVERSVVLSSSVFNRSATEVDAGIGLHITSFAAAVPEPSTWALLGPGLAALGAAPRRRPGGKRREGQDA